MQLQAKVKAYISRPLKECNTKNLTDLYGEVFGILLSSSCQSCAVKAYYELKAWLKQQGQNIDMKINLITCEFSPDNVERKKEIDFCLNHNKSNKNFNKVITVTGRKPTYKELFDITKQFPSDVNIIANTDIFFDDSILKATQIDEHECFALSRWDYIGDNQARHFNRHDSQDVWIFHGAVKENVFAGFQIGTPGCDNRIAYELKKAGYNVRNPSFTIRSYHYHLSGVHTYKQEDKIKEPYLFLPCTRL